MTVSEIVDKVLALAYPKKFGHSMLALKEHHVRHGLTEVQRRVEGFRVANTTIFEGKAEYMVSGATLVPAPQGFVEQVAVGNTNCMTTFCVMEPYPKVQQRQADWARVNLCGDATKVLPCYPQAHVVWARDRGDIMVYPWVPAPWQIGIRWNGIVRDWGETNDVWWGESAIEALRLYVLWKSAVDDNCDQNRIGIAKTDFVDEAAKLKTEDFQIRNPSPLPTYIAEILSGGICGAVAPTTPPPVEPPVSGDAYSSAFSGGFAGGKDPEAPAPDPAEVTSAKSRAGLDAELPVLINDNDAGEITPADMRLALSSSNYSAVNKVDETTSYTIGFLGVPDAASARAVLALGNSATLNVGTTAGTVAAGDHTHPAPTAPDFVQIRADNGTVVNVYVKFKEGAYVIKVGQPIT